MQVSLDKVGVLSSKINENETKIKGSTVHKSSRVHAGSGEGPHLKGV